MKLGHEDFKFVKKKLTDDRTFHEKEFMQRINPDIIDAYYEGNPEKNNSNYSSGVGLRMTQNRLFPTTATLIPQLFPYRIKFLLNSKRDDPEQLLNTKITQSAINYYWIQMQAENENKFAIMSAWLYGFGVVKQGFFTNYKKVNNEPNIIQQTQGFFNKIGEKISGKQKENIEREENSEYIDDEGTFLNYVSARDVLLDKNKQFGKGKWIHQRIEKSVFEVKMSGIYNLPDEFYQRYIKNNSSKESTITLWESWMREGDDLYVCVSCEQWEKPLRFEKSSYMSEGFPYQLLSFNKQLDTTYPISHMKVAQNQQRLVDYLLNLQRETVEKYKDMTIFNGDAFDMDSRNKIKSNVIGSNIFTKPGFSPSGAVSHVTTGNIPKELYSLQGILDKNIGEILAVIGARQSGDPEFETATQEKIAEYGNQIRSKGLWNEIEVFLTAQCKKMIQDLQQFGVVPVKLKVEDVPLQKADGEMVMEDWIEFGGNSQTYQNLKDVITSEVDIEIDISEQMKRDMPVVRKQLSEVISLVSNPAIQQALMQEGKKIKLSALISDLLNSFETINSADKYIEDMGQNPMNQMMGGNPMMPENQQMPMGNPVNATPEEMIASNLGPQTPSY